MKMNTPKPIPDGIPGPASTRRGTPLQVAALTVIGTLVLSIFGAHDLPGWADQLPENPATLAFADAARAWDAALGQFGLTTPYITVRAALRRIEGMAFAPPQDKPND